MLYLKSKTCRGQDHLVGARSCRWSCRWVLSVVLSASSVGVLSARLVGVLSACLVGDLSGHISTSSKLANQPHFQPAAQPASLVGALSALFRKNVKLNLGLVGALSGPCFGLVGVLSVPFGSIGAFLSGQNSSFFRTPCPTLSVSSFASFVLSVSCRGSCRKPCRGQGFP